MEQGLPQNGVTAIVQTQDGYLWVATYGGLVRFDGARFTVFDGGNTPELHDSRITSLFEDADRNLWIGHESGELTRVRAGRFEARKPRREARREKVSAIATDAGGGLWLLGQSGLLANFDSGQILEPPAKEAPLPGSAALTRDAMGRLWVTRSGAISALRNSRLEEKRFGATDPNHFVMAAAPSRDGAVWVAIDGSIRKWREDRWELDWGRFPWGQSSVTAMLETKRGDLAVGTIDQGLFVLSPGGAVTHVSRGNGLPHDWIRCLAEDREGNLWLGAGSGGLVVLRPSRVQTHDAPDGWQGRAVLTVAQGRDHALWVGTEGAGLYRFHQEKWTRFAEPEGLPNLFIWSVAEDHAGQVWVGSWGSGAFQLQGERFVRAPGMEDSTAAVPALLAAQHGPSVWLGTGTGLLGWDGTNLARLGVKEGLASGDIRAVARDPNGALWLGMFGGGLAWLQGGELKQWRRTDGLSSDFVQCLLPDQDGTLWIGTADNGLNRLRQGRIARIGRSQGLPNHVICHIADDGMGHLWMSSHGGLFRVDKTELNRCADGLTAAVTCLSFGLEDGLPTPECSGGLQPAGCRTPDGRLWFTTSKGLVSVDPKSITTNSLPPPVVIEELKVEDTALDLDAPNSHTTTVPPGRQRFEFHYTALSFSAPEKVRFKYRLDGLESDWVEAGNRRTATYSYLPPGDYSFRVKACNNDGIWSTGEAVRSFTVLPFSYQTWWFKGLMTLLALGAGLTGALLLAHRRVRLTLEQTERQQAVERERARIAQDIHDDLGASLTRITLLSQSARADLGNPTQAAQDLDRIYATARELTRAMDEIVWAVNPRHDSLDSLASYLGQFAQDFLATTGLRCRLDIPVQLPAWPLTAEVRHNLFLAFKEALHNVLKHARATEVRVTLILEPARFELVVEDNGVGFEPALAASPATEKDSGGNGLRNMRERLSSIAGVCRIQSTPGHGTLVGFTIPMHTRNGVNGR